MPYQNPQICRFYVNVIEWLMQNGLVTNVEIDSLFRTLPVNTNNYTFYSITLPSFSQILTNQSFIAVLGHTYGNDSSNYFRLGNIDDYTEIINANINNSTPQPVYNGFSIATFPYNDTALSFINEPMNFSVGIGSIIIGTYYDMPHSPELKLTMTREMDGVDRVRTKGGSDLVGHGYLKPAMWGSAAAWELYSGLPHDQELSRVGRRTWDLSFNFLQGSDIFPESSSINWEGNYDTANEAIGRTLLDDESFFGQVIHKTNGGQLPFIFQPDKDDPTNFAICKFQNSFQFDQVANGVYNTKLKIREIL